MWGDLRVAIQKIHRKESTTDLSYERLYRYVYDLVSERLGRWVYDRARKSILLYLMKQLERIKDCPDETFLATIQDVWTDHARALHKICDVFMYLDKGMKERKIEELRRELPLYECGVKLFRDKVVFDPDVRGRHQKLLLENVARERRGLVVDRTVMKHALSMLVDIGSGSRKVYVSEFENKFLSETHEYYVQEAGTLLSSETCTQYLARANRRIEEEDRRVSHYLDSSSQSSLREVVVSSLVEKHAKRLIEMKDSGCAHMFANCKYDGMRQMFELFAISSAHVPLLAAVRACMSECIVERGEAIVRNATASSKETDGSVAMVENVVKMHTTFLTFVRKSFAGRAAFSRSMKEGFERFLSKSQRPARFLSVYLDRIMRKPVASREVKLEEALMIFGYLRDRDVFESHYRRFLEIRLLNELSESMDAERWMISKFKTLCGYIYASKMEGMFKDIRVSKETTGRFLEWTRRQGGFSPPHSSAPSASIRVLTVGFWSSTPMSSKTSSSSTTTTSTSCALPRSLRDLRTQFETFYHQHHSGRQLSWNDALGRVDLLYYLPRSGKRKELNVSTYQMCILSLFNSFDEITFAKIRSSTKIPKEDLKRHLMSLCMKRVDILVHVRPKERGRLSDLDAHVFRINKAFDAKHFRVVVPLAKKRSKRTPPSASSSFSKTIEKERQILVEASVVRIMKARLSLEHNDLVTEVVRQLSTRFQPSPHFVKQRIEDLIAREYIKRSGESSRTYMYIA
eukprot:g2078.t1